MEMVRKWRFWALLATVVTALLCSQIGSASASNYCVERVGVMLPGGPGHPGPVYAGTWKCGSVVGFCGNFPLHSPNHSGSTAILHRHPGLSQHRSDLAAWINGTYRLTNNRQTAARAQYAYWKVLGGKQFRTYDHWATRHHRFGKIRHGANQMIARAELMVGLRLRVHVAAAVVGQTKHDYVKVTGTGGKPVRGVRVSLSSNANGHLSAKSSVSNRKGLAWFYLKQVDLGKAAVTASVRTVNLRYIVSTVPSVGRQHIYAVTRHRTLRARASANKLPSGPTMSTSCTTQCDGVARVTWIKGVETGASAMRYKFNVGNKTVARCDAAGGHNCKASAKLSDGTVWSSYSYCYLTKVHGRCKTSWVTVKVHEEIICPAWVQWTFKCDCGGAPELQATSLVSSPRSYSFTVQYGSNSKTVSLANGTPKNVALTGYKSGQEIAASFSAYRDSGHTRKLVSHTLFSGLKLG